jgi:hypothetical protein
MTLTIRRTTNKDQVLHDGTVAATLLKDIGNASNQPYLQAIASISLLIMETVQVSHPRLPFVFKPDGHSYLSECGTTKMVGRPKEFRKK